MIDPKKAQSKFVRRVERLTKKHGFEKKDGVYQRVCGEVVHLVDYSRSLKGLTYDFEFMVYPQVYSPGLYERVYRRTGGAIYYFQLRTSLLRLPGQSQRQVWRVEDETALERAFSEMEAVFEEAASRFFSEFSTTQSVVDRCREGGRYVRAARDLAAWEADMYEGRTTREARPGGPPPDGW